MSMTDKELFEYYTSYQTKYNEILKNITHYIKLKYGLYVLKFIIQMPLSHYEKTLLRI